jgi:UDP-N-acetylmuramoyl-tripeptide--D-alanyl-D-alanine ligase
MEFRRTLMMLQQNSYRNERYRRYLSQSGESTSYGKLACAALALFSLAAPVPHFLAMTVQGVVFLLLAVAETRRKYKKPLVVTPRVRRISSVMAAITVICIAVYVGWLCGTSVLYALFVCGTVIALAFFLSAQLAQIANWLLKPVEKHINQGYLNDAARILASMPDLTVVGITGSYGKTSTKHYLHRILSEQFPVCMTPGSFNTTMGVVRTVREYLKPYDRVFICEMGAKQPGDVREICDLVHPSVGIVTAVGPQHLESFKTIENVQRTKFELIDALPVDGYAVINNDFPYVANRPVENVKLVTRYGVEPRASVQFSARDVTYSAAGTEFTVVHPGGELRLRTRLVGECNISNLLAAVAVALHLGVPEQKIRYAVERIEQVEHRLNVKRTPGGITIIDDAFNSNPTGSGMALDVLAAMKGGKRIVITPGMIELGEQQHELNRKFGEKIATSVDVAIVVGQYNRDAIMEGIGTPDGVEVHAVESFAEAQRLLAGMAGAGDIVLYENDLPDTFK